MNREDAHKIELLTGLRGLGLPLPVPEYQFHPTRRWRFDWAWATETKKIALEVEGGIWIGKGHANPIRFCKDIIKYNTAALMGWTVLRCTPQMIHDGSIFTTLEEALK